MSIVKKASAHWEGDLKSGIGSISTETGVLREAPYGFKARFEGRQRHQPGRTDRCSPRRLFLDGTVHDSGRCRPDC